MFEKLTSKIIELVCHVIPPLIRVAANWVELLNNSFYNGVSGVIVMDDSNDLEDYFTKDKDKGFKSAPNGPSSGSRVT